MPATAVTPIMGAVHRHEGACWSASPRTSATG
jgi:hypothetical protein